jgi:hypothetical protein
VIDTVPTSPAASKRRARTRGRKSETRSSFSSLFAALCGVVVLFLALIWVIRLESELPSIRVSVPSGGATIPGMTLEPGEYRSDNPAIVLSGNWFNQTLGTSGPAKTTSSMVTSTSGSSMTLRFYGTDVVTIARIGPESGKFHVTIDGEPSPILPSDDHGSFVDLYSNQAEDQSILLATGLAHRDHTLQITSEGTDDVAISGFNVSANTPFPWAFIFLYVALSAALFVLVRISVVAMCKRVGWL